MRSDLKLDCTATPFEKRLPESNGTIPVAMCRRPESDTLPLLISIHDVTPCTLHLADSIVKRLLEADLRKITLLIVPGLKWDKKQLRTLKHYQTDEVGLAGHGWRHEGPPEKPFHRWHSRLFSRNAAEHLSLETSRIENLIQNCYEWFEKNGLLPPKLYVPPAWAMGELKLANCKNLPFRFYETLSGIYDSKTDTMKKLPLLGFEADTGIRKQILSLTNRLNLAWAQHFGLPIRVAIHPLDFKLKLSQELGWILRCGQKTMDYEDIRRRNDSCPRW